MVFSFAVFFSYSHDAATLSPFLLLDYAGPENFSPSEKRRGVGAHPHRGFETVTISYSGEVEHRDSSGAGGTIRAGDVQWMTAASGVVHEEFHGSNYAKRGGPFEMIQLWVNLAAKDKKAPPGYQNITDAQIPRVELLSGGGFVRVIAGTYQSVRGPAGTFSPMNVWDMRLKAGGRQDRCPGGMDRRALCAQGQNWGLAKLQEPRSWRSFNAKETRLKSGCSKTARYCSSMVSRSMNRLWDRGLL
jgi:quercetin 2,3-dioxygenase